MSTNKSAKLFNKLGVHLEDAVDVFELLKKLDTTSSSSNATNINIFELNAQGADLNARELGEMNAANAKLEEDKLQLEAEKTQFIAAKIQLEAEQNQFRDAQIQLEAEQNQFRDAQIQLGAEKTQFTVAQIQLKAAQSQLEDAKRNLESAQTQLEEARGQLETARKHLEAAKTQTDITNTTLAAAEQSLDAAKMRFEGATKQLNDAKSKFEDATTKLEAAATSATATEGVRMSMSLEEENNKLRTEVGQLRSEISTNEAELKKSKEENEHLATDNSKLKNEKLRVEDELKESVLELEQVKNEIKALQADKNKMVEEEPRREKSGNPKVFFDMTIRGESAGRIVFELFADTMPDHVELFRAFCTGEKGVSQKGIPLHYKGTSITYINPACILAGKLGTMSIDETQSIYGDLKRVGKEIVKESYTLGNLFMYPEPSSYRDYSFGIFISTARLDPPEDSDHVVIGKVIQGIEVLHAIKIAYPVHNHRHGYRCVYMGELVIANSGQLP